MRRSSVLLTFATAVVLVCAVGCEDDLPRVGAGDYCQRDDQCLPGLICLSRVCSTPSARRGDPLPEIDAGQPSMDAGPMDSGPADAGAVDAGAMDAGTTDAGTSDAGSADAGTDGGGLIDAAIPLIDAGV